MKQATASFGTATVSPTLRHLGSPTLGALKAWGDSSYDSISVSFNRVFRSGLACACLTRFQKNIDNAGNASSLRASFSLGCD